MFSFTHSPRKILGYRKDGRPIYPIAGGSESAPEVDSTSEPSMDSYSTPVASDNPAWQPFLDVLPDSLHETVRPVLSDWDRNVNARIEQIQNEYAPYRSFKDQGIDPEELDYSYQVLQALNENPRDVILAMAEHFGLSLTEAQAQQLSNEVQQQQQQNGEDAPVDPRIAFLEQGFQTLAAITLQQQEQVVAREADRQLEETLQGLRNTHGDFNENAVLANMLAGMDPESAVQAYKQVEAQILQNANRPPAPRIIGSGNGSVPNERVNPAAMTDQERRALVTQMLMNNNT